MIAAVQGGLSNPLLVPAHVLTLCSLGLLIGQQPTSWRFGLLAAFAASLVVGIAVVVAAFVVRDADVAVLGVAAVAGLAVAAAHRFTIVVAVPLALTAGAAIALDSVPQDISMLRSFLALIGTAVTGLLVVALLGALAALARYDWQRIGIRIAGSWIAASAILVLALRIVEA
jgi:urease accessory protein